MPSRKLHSWMWAEACELLGQAERLHRQYFRLGAATGARSWEPPVDVLASTDHLLVTVALPGVSPEELRVRAGPGVLIVEALRRPPARGEVAIHRLEIPYGRFERRIALPPGHYELLEQTLHQGCLELRLRKH